MNSIRQDLNKKYKVILAIEKRLGQLQEEYNSIKANFFHPKRKRELLSEREAKKRELKRANEEYQLIPKMHGFKSTMSLE